ncbi:hypothetical protein K525DRAFT_256201 [Schizophyllum commune Loenen D]|nr:hypothetical protein K525DRAFT_256201 [Schizophyllum commune Loenen D]
MNKAAIALRSIIFFVWAFFACWTAGTSVVLILANARLEYGVAASTVLALIVTIVTLFMIIASHTELRYHYVRTGNVLIELTWVAISSVLGLVDIGLAFGVDAKGCRDTGRKLVVVFTTMGWSYLVIFSVALLWRCRVDGRYILSKSVFEINWLRRRDATEKEHQEHEEYKGRKQRPQDIQVHGIFDDITQSSAYSTSPGYISPPARAASRQPETHTPTPLWAKQASIRRGVDPPFRQAPSEQHSRPLQRAHPRPHRHRHHERRSSRQARATLAPPQPNLSAQPSTVSANVANDMSYITRAVSPLISDLGTARQPEQGLKPLPSLAEMVGQRVVRPPPRQDSLGRQGSSSAPRRHGGADPIDRPFSPARSTSRRPTSEESLTRFYYL